MKHVTKYKTMRKRMIEFLRKFENRGIKIARVNSIPITNISVNLHFFTLILYGVGVRVIEGIPCIVHLYREVYEKS